VCGHHRHDRQAAVADRNGLYNLPSVYWVGIVAMSLDPGTIPRLPTQT